MEYATLGSRGPRISRVGFGAWATGGGGWWGGWGHQDDAASVAAIHRALELGVNWIDTAPVYGRGHSERVIASALRGMDERPLLFTKCGLSWDDAGTVIVDLRPATLRREIEASLHRLAVDMVDLYQIHWPAADPADLGDITSAWETLVELRDEGKVRYVGVSNFEPRQLEQISELEPPVSLQPPYSLLNRDVEAETLPFCSERGVGVIAYSPMGSGLLTGSMTAERARNLADDDWRRQDANFQEPKLSQNLDVAAGLERVAEHLGRNPGEVAVAWVLRNPAVTGAIVGFRRPAQVESLVGAAVLELDDTDAAELGSLLG